MYCSAMQSRCASRGYRADRAKYPVRLVQFYSQGQLHRYLTNVLDPQQLPLAEVARLYARRWDIELAFAVLKDHLHVGQLWSAKWPVIQVQIWCALLLAQLFMACRRNWRRQRAWLLSRARPTC